MRFRLKQPQLARIACSNNGANSVDLLAWAAASRGSLGSLGCSALALWEMDGTKVEAAEEEETRKCVAGNAKMLKSE